MMQYCTHPAHLTNHKPIPWFPSSGPADRCPAHRERPKERLRFVNGQWVRAVGAG